MAKTPYNPNSNEPEFAVFVTPPTVTIGGFAGVPGTTVGVASVISEIVVVCVVVLDDSTELSGTPSELSVWFEDESGDMGQGVSDGSV